MSPDAKGPPADGPERTRSGSPRRDRPARERPPRSRRAGERARGAAEDVGSAWRALTSAQKLAAITAIALLISMLLPWYQETGNALVNNRLVPIDNAKNAFQVYSFVEAAVFVVSAGVLALLYARGHRKAFHLPGGDGAVIIAAGMWVMFLVFYRQLDKPDGRHEGPINTSVGVEWGIFVAFLLGALLAYAGYRIRATHVPEPVADDAPPPRSDATRHAWNAEWSDAPGPAPAGERTTVAEPRPPRQRREGDDSLDPELSVDEPAEYRPPPRRK
jgi:hypothetical protein